MTPFKKEIKLLGEYLDYEQERTKKNNWPVGFPIMKVHNRKIGFVQGDGEFVDYESIMNKKYLENET